MSSKINPSQIQKNAIAKSHHFVSPNGAAPKGPGELVTVKSGDTLRNLAAAKFGDGEMWKEIAAHNPQIANPNKIWPGDQIRMPMISEKKLSPEQIAKQTGEAEAKKQVGDFSQNDQSGKVAKQKLGTLNFLRTQLDSQDKPGQTPTAQNSRPSGEPIADKAALITGPKQTASGRDASVDGAISNIKKQPRPLSAEAMREAIVQGVGDRDGQAAGAEFKQLSRFVNKNLSKFSPEAKQVWGLYEKAAMQAQKSGAEGINDKSWNHMLAGMDKICAKAATKETGTADKTEAFDWGDVPVAARSPELQKVLSDLRTQGLKPQQETVPGETQAAMGLQECMGNSPYLDAEMATLAKGMDMKSPLSFEDMLFLLQMKYATNKEKELLQQMNALAKGDAPRPQAGQQAGQQPQTRQAGQQPQTRQARPQPQTRQADRDYMQQMAQYQAQQQGHAPSQPAVAQPQNPISQQHQDTTKQIMQGIGDSIRAYESAGSEGGEMITLNEMNKLVGLAQRLPPEQQQMLKAQAYHDAVTEGGLTPQAFEALMRYVNSQASPNASAPTQQATGPQATAQQSTAPSARRAAPSATPRAQAPAYNPSADAVDLHKAMRGLGTDEEAIFKVLTNKSPEQMKSLRKAYKTLYGESLSSALKGDLSHSELDRAMSLLRGDTIGAAAHSLFGAMHDVNSMTGLGTDEDAIFNTLENLNPDQMNQLAARYQKETGRNLVKDLRSDLSGQDEARALALLTGNRALADATVLKKAMSGNHGLSMGTDEEAIFKHLEEASASERQAMAAAYQQAYGENLIDALKGDLSFGEEDRALKLLLRTD